MILWIKCLSTSFLFPPSVFHVCIIPVLKMISLSSYVAWQFTYVTFCLDHWYLVIQWTLFNISSWNLCLPFLSLTTTFCLKTVLCLVFLKVCLNCLHCCELTTIWLVWLCAFKNGFRSEVKQLETHSTGKNQLLDCSLISLTEVHVSDPVHLLELKRNTESIAVWTKKLSERKVCCDTLSLCFHLLQTINILRQLA